MKAYEGHGDSIFKVLNGQQSFFILLSETNAIVWYHVCLHQCFCTCDNITNCKHIIIVQLIVESHYPLFLEQCAIHQPPNDGHTIGGLVHDSMNDVNCFNSSHVYELLNNCEELVSAIHDTIQDLELKLIWLKLIVETNTFEKTQHNFQNLKISLKTL